MESCYEPDLMPTPVLGLGPPLMGQKYKACVVLFTKPAIAGRVKTRLCPPLRPEQAAALHGAFVGDLVEQLLTGSFDLRIAWALEPGEEADLALLPRAAQDPNRVACRIQQGTDLGERMFHALKEAAVSYDLVAVVGSDLPGLGSARIDEAFRAVAGDGDGAQVAIGPTEDGGYYLLAARSTVLSRHWFDGVEWSSSKVLAETMDRCRDQRLVTAMLAEGRDVDTGADLRHLVRSWNNNQQDLRFGDRLSALLREWRLTEPALFRDLS